MYKQFLVSCIYQLQICLALMSSLITTQCSAEGPRLEVRRSGRKRVKLNHKRNPLLSRPIKQIRNRLTDIKPSRNFDHKPPKIKLSPYQNYQRLQTLPHPERPQIITNMKQAVKEQQRKLKRLFSVKLIQEKDFIDQKESGKTKKTEIIALEKTQTSIVEQKMHSQEYESGCQVKQDLMEIGTAEELEYEKAGYGEEVEEDLMMIQESEFYLAQLPSFKKQSSRLLSDNYQNQDLLYTIEHMVPNWQREEIDLPGQLQFSSE